MSRIIPNLELKIPPPVVALLIGVAMWGLARFTPQLGFDSPLRGPLAILLTVVGVACAVLGSLAFRRAKTTVNPMKPDTATTLVVVGIYRYTRNPMYLGLAFVLLGWACHLAAPLALLGPVAFVFYITRFQIIPEERALQDKFGQAYRDYQGQVRRWL
jgi:protein-S-isoprenylcysteine O-methyltransferase Ste14